MSVDAAPPPTRVPGPPVRRHRRGHRGLRAPRPLRSITRGRWIARPRVGGLAAAALVAPALVACLAVRATAPLVELAYPAVALVGAALLVRRRPDAYLELVLWIWLLTPGVRRVVDYAGGWTPVSPVMLAPPLVALAAAPVVLRRWHALPRRQARPLLVVTGVIAYAAALGAVRNGIGASVADALLWTSPLALALYVLAHRAHLEALTATLRRVAVPAVLLLGVYGVIQYVAIPPWDAHWMRNAPLASIGSPEPFAVRVFSTLNSPGPFGSVMAVLLLVAASAGGVTRRGWRQAALVAGLAGLGLSAARTGWLVLLVGVAVVLLLGRARSRAGVVWVFVGLAVFLAVGGPLSTVVVDRVEETRTLSEDDSFRARTSLYASFGPLVVADPVGAGLGATGVATKVGNEGRLGALGNLDSGLLGAFHTAGLVGGLVYLGVVTFQSLALLRAAWSRGDPEVVVGAAGTAALAVQLLSSALTGVVGLLFWLLWALGAARLRADAEGLVPSHGARPAARATAR